MASHATLVERVTIRFDDVNGPRGGVDIDCVIKVVVSSISSVIVAARGESPAAAFARALPRLKRALRQQIDRHGLSAKRSPRVRDTAVASGPPAVDASSLIGRGVGRGPDALARALDRPEKRRRDALTDTAARGVSETDRRAGGAHTSRRNTRGRRDGMTVTLEDSVTRPSRKSTRRSANAGKPSHGKERHAVAQVVKPSARSGRSAATKTGGKRPLRR